MIRFSFHVISKRFPSKRFIIKINKRTTESSIVLIILITLRRARLAFKIAAAFARAVPFCNFDVARVGFLTTPVGFLTPAADFAPGFLAGTFFTTLPSLLFEAVLAFFATGFLSPAVFFSAGFLSVAFLAGAAFLSPAFLSAALGAALAAAGFLSAGLDGAALGAAAVLGAVFFSATAGLDSVAGRFSAFLAAGSAAGFLAAAPEPDAAGFFSAGFLSAAGFAAGVSFLAPVVVDAAGFLSFLSDDSPAKRAKK